MGKIKSYGKLTKQQQKLVEDNLWISGKLAYRAMVLTRGFTGALTRSDLEQVANFALCVAAKKYNPTKKVKFSTYAWTYANGYISHALRDKSRMVRLPRWVPKLRQEIAELKSEGKSYEEIQKELDIDSRKVYDCEMSYKEIHLPLDYEDEDDDHSYMKQAVYEGPYENFQDPEQFITRATKYSEKELAKATEYIYSEGEIEPEERVIHILYDVLDIAACVWGREEE